MQAGVYGFFQHQYNYFFNDYTDDTPNFAPSSIGVNGGLAAEFINDKFKVTPWLTLIAGLRATEFTDSQISENTAEPRFGVAIRVPHLNWVFRGFYGYYYQAPPLSTATNQLQQGAGSKVLAFAPLYGERDREWQYGVMIPYRGWTLDADTYQTFAHNWLDHNNIGESNIFWPITWDYALIQGLGAYAAIAEPLASRAVSPCLCESNRSGNFADHGRLDLSLPATPPAPRYSAGTFARRP